MKIIFNISTTIEIPDADIFPPKEEVENDLVKWFKDEGMILHGLEVTNYCIAADDIERRIDGSD